MTLESIYLLAGILTGVGVLISLIFVGMQIRAATTLAKLEISDRVIAVHQDVINSAISDPVMGAPILRANAGQEDFTEEEWGTISFFVANISSTIRGALDAKRRGLFEPEAEEFVWRAMCYYLSKPAYARAWRWHIRSGISGNALAEATNAEFNKRYPELADSLRVDTAKAPPGSPTDEEEPTS